MIALKNPVRDGHWASVSLHAFLAGKLDKVNFTSIRVNGRIVGKVQNGMFIKRLTGSKHFLRVPPAIAFDIDSLRQAEKAGASQVKIIDIETGNEYQVFLTTIWTRGFYFDRGHGRQIGLVFPLWSKGKDPVCEQLGFWGAR